MNEVQARAAVILNAERAAERMLERVKSEHKAVMSLSRDELSALAQQMLTVAHIASRYHCERSAVGSLAPEAFSPPT